MSSVKFHSCLFYFVNISLTWLFLFIYFRFFFIQGPTRTTQAQFPQGHQAFVFTPLAWPVTPSPMHACGLSPIAWSLHNLPSTCMLIMQNPLRLPRIDRLPPSPLAPRPLSFQPHPHTHPILSFFTLTLSLLLYPLIPLVKSTPSANAQTH